MFKVVELSTGMLLTELGTIEESLSYISDIESCDIFPQLLEKYGSVRRVQQELTVMSE